MSVVSCPKCSGQVAMPPDAPTDGWVRCPICRAEYRAYHLLEFVPPSLELIDEPAHPFEGSVPARDVLAAASTTACTAPTVSAIAAAESDSVALEATDELAVAPVGAATGAISSADVGDDSNVFTFDDSLLLDEPTDELPRLREGEIAEVAALQSDTLAVSQADSADQLDWPDADVHEPPPLDVKSMPATDDLRATEEHSSAVTIFDRGGAAPVMSVPPIGLAPRRKARRRHPVLVILGIVGGGFLGLVLGYGILMWFFDPPKDPLRIAPSLPGFLVPEALRSTGEVRIAKSPTEDDAVAGSPRLDDSAADGESQQRSPDNELLPPLADPAVEQKRSNIEPPQIDPFEAQTDQTKSAKSDATDQKRDSLTELFGDAAVKEREPGATQPLKNPFEAAATDETPAVDPLSTKQGDLNIAPPDVVEELGPVSDKRYTHEDLAAAVSTARLTTERALTLPIDADASEKRKVNGPFYMNLCKIAESLTFLERSADKQSDDKVTTAVIEAMLDAVPDARRLEELGKLAGYWYDRPQGNGIVLSGIVKKSTPRGKLVESVVETLGPPRLITVISPSALTDDPSRPVLVVGTIVRDAAKNLRGYEGTAKTIVWASMAIDPLAPSRGLSTP
jgi:hypothetical protein